MADVAESFNRMSEEIELVNIVVENGDLHGKRRGNECPHCLSTR
jgi:hypothetical protein